MRKIFHSIFGEIKRSPRKSEELEMGYEVPDPEPAYVPTGLARRPNIETMIKRMIRTEASLHAQSQGAETFEEADDFDIEDDPMDNTPYEVDFDPHPLPETPPPSPTGSSPSGQTETPSEATETSSTKPEVSE